MLWLVIVGVAVALLAVVFIVSARTHQEGSTPGRGEGSANSTSNRYKNRGSKDRGDDGA